MTLLTKNTKAKADYQQWVAADITAGDILDVYGSLGRAAHSVTIENPSGQAIVRFNVVHEVHAQYDQNNESWVGLGQGTMRSRPRLETEVKLTKPDIVIEAGQIQTWDMTEISVRDIEVRVKTTDLKITVT